MPGIQLSHSLAAAKFQSRKLLFFQFNGWWRRKEGDGRKEWKGVGIIRFNGRRSERRPLVYSITVF